MRLRHVSQTEQSHPPPSPEVCHPTFLDAYIWKLPGCVCTGRSEQTDVFHGYYKVRSNERVRSNRTASEFEISVKATWVFTDVSRLFHVCSKSLTYYYCVCLFSTVPNLRFRFVSRSLLFIYAIRSIFILLKKMQNIETTRSRSWERAL